MRYLLVLLTATLLFTSLSAQEHEHPQVTLELVVDGLTAPVDLDAVPDDSGRLFVVEQTGTIHIIDADGTLLEQPFLDIRDRVEIPAEGYTEMGLLGLAFHPDYANNGRFFVYYTAPPGDNTPTDWAGRDRLSEFQVSADNPDLADAASEQILFDIDDPQSNHNGGDISFGPDGFLYVPIGDGGNANDEGMGHTDGIGNAQDLTRMLGKIHRIDVDNGEPYSIPDDNPFVGDNAVPNEIWAWGFRNPWRATWDRQTGQMFVADAGQEVWEEVSIVAGGRNYGWRVREGSHCFTPAYPEHNPLSCTETGNGGERLQPPIIEHSHQVGLVIVGGYVYRGTALGDDFTGHYVFGNWSTSHGEPAGVLLIATPPPQDMAEPAMWRMHHLQVTNTEGHHIGEYLLAFGEDAEGELYVLTSQSQGPSGTTGKVWKIVPPPESSG